VRIRMRSQQAMNTRCLNAPLGYRDLVLECEAEIKGEINKVIGNYLFEALRAHLRARGMTYEDLAKALKMSESAVKKMFSKRDCTLSRLDEICTVMQVDLSEIAKGNVRQSRLINELQREHEQEIVDDIRLFIVAVCVMQSLTFEEIVATYKLTATLCIATLARLDRIGFIELLPNNRYRLLVSRTFRWIPDGPIMRWTKAHAPDYFDHLFDGPGETLRVINVRLSEQSRVALLGRLDQLAYDYEEQHNADAWLKAHERFPLSLCLAVRPWEPRPFRDMRRRD
jgi:DNA-binding Xre family transcriptional regulator